jgi:2-polyprenyl-6-methoxyphenol hydroxylase-like FAD-dependent oxidoreductase
MVTILGDGADVLVVGAGPVGLTMACELHRPDISCRIIDDEPGPTPPNEQARALETFEKIGLVDPLLERGRKIHALNAYDGGRRCARLELDFDALSTPYPFILILPQAETERRLIDVLEGLGGPLVGNHRYGAGDCLSLIRPDGYIGYRARPVDPDKLDAYLARLLVRS